MISDLQSIFMYHVYFLQTSKDHFPFVHNKLKTGHACEISGAVVQKIELFATVEFLQVRVIALCSTLNLEDQVQFKYLLEYHTLAEVFQFYDVVIYLPLLYSLIW